MAAFALPLLIVQVVVVVLVLLLRDVGGLHPLEPAPPVEPPLGSAHPVLQAPPLLSPARRVGVTIGDAINARLRGVDQPLPLESGRTNRLTLSLDLHIRT